jgi:histidyl-tRNA synthetase
MESIKAPRGTRDILGDESWKWAYVLKVCRDVADCFGYRRSICRVRTHGAVLSGASGTPPTWWRRRCTPSRTEEDAASPFVRELTASMVRSYLEHDLRNQSQPAKLWSAGPMFRYERPQKGGIASSGRWTLRHLGPPIPWWTWR